MMAQSGVLPSVNVRQSGCRTSAAAMVLHRAAGAISTCSTIRAGDLVIVYERFDSMKSVYVNPGESYGNRYGNFKLKVRECSLLVKAAALCYF